MSWLLGLQVTQVTQVTQGLRVLGLQILRPHISGLQITQITHGLQVTRVSGLGSPDYPWSQVSMVSDLPSHHPQIHGTGLTSHLAIGAKTTLLQYAINGLPACLG